MKRFHLVSTKTSIERFTDRLCLIFQRKRKWQKQCCNGCTNTSDRIHTKCTDWNWYDVFKKAHRVKPTRTFQAELQQSVNLTLIFKDQLKIWSRKCQNIVKCVPEPNLIASCCPEVKNIQFIRRDKATQPHSGDDEVIQCPLCLKNDPISWLVIDEWWIYMHVFHQTINMLYLIVIWFLLCNKQHLNPFSINHTTLLSFIAFQNLSRL